MLQELNFGGLLFSPMAVMIPVAFMMAFATRLLLHLMDLRRLIWQEAWFDVSLFTCYLAAIVAFFGL